MPVLDVEVVRRSVDPGLADLALQGEQALLQAEAEGGPQVGGVPPSLTVDQSGGHEEEVEDGVVLSLGLDNVRVRLMIRSSPLDSTQILLAIFRLT